jgi:hypothetical protein
MPRIDQQTIKAVLKHFVDIKILKINELASLLKCSIPNARLKLKQWRAYTSYNQNGRFYSLQQVPRFDQYGIWRHNKAAFSKHGNLKKTVVHLVSTASAGLSGKQLGDILGLLPQSFLHHFRKCPSIRREKFDGVYIYFGDDHLTYTKQLKQRESLPFASSLTKLSDGEAIMILVAIIKHHSISPEDIMNLPDIKKRKLTRRLITAFMEQHELIKKNPVSKR